MVSDVNALVFELQPHECCESTTASLVSTYRGCNLIVDTILADNEVTTHLC